MIVGSAEAMEDLVVRIIALAGACLILVLLLASFVAEWDEDGQ
jgi:hypothetical protein